MTNELHTPPLKTLKFTQTEIAFLLNLMEQVSENFWNEHTYSIDELNTSLMIKLQIINTPYTTNENN